MTEITHELLDELTYCSDYADESACRAMLRTIVECERAKLKPVWVLPENKTICARDESGDSWSLSAEMQREIYKLEIMHSLWLAYGEGYCYKLYGGNSYPIYNGETERFQWGNSTSIRSVNNFHYSKEIPEVLQHLNEHKELLIK